MIRNFIGPFQKWNVYNRDLWRNGHVLFVAFTNIFAYDAVFIIFYCAIIYILMLFKPVLCCYSSSVVQAVHTSVFRRDVMYMGHGHFGLPSFVRIIFIFIYLVVIQRCVFFVLLGLCQLLSHDRIRQGIA